MTYGSKNYLLLSVWEERRTISARDLPISWCTHSEGVWF